MAPVLSPSQRLPLFSTWPPLTVASGENVQGPTGATGAFGTITRQGGALQVTYDGRPLYNYSGDSAAGDTNGQGTNGVWFVASLSGSAGPGGAPTPAVNPAVSPAGGGGPVATPTKDSSYSY